MIDFLKPKQAAPQEVSANDIAAIIENHLQKGVITQNDLAKFAKLLNNEFKTKQLIKFL